MEKTTNTGARVGEADFYRRRDKIAGSLDRIAAEARQYESEAGVISTPATDTARALRALTYEDARDTSPEKWRALEEVARDWARLLRRVRAFEEIPA